jgi:hypothetical protein
MPVRVIGALGGASLARCMVVLFVNERVADVAGGGATSAVIAALLHPPP